MSILSVATIQSANSSSDLTLKASNTSGSQIVLYSNGQIQFETISSFNVTELSSNTANISNLSVGALYANGSTGTSGQLLQSNGSTVSWSNIGVITANNTDAQTFYIPMTNVTSGAWSNSVVSDTKLYFVPSTGTLNSTIFNSLSDANKKKDVATIVNALDTVSILRGVEFNWVDNSEKSAGVIAQEIEAVLPHLVSQNENGLKSVNYLGLIGYLIEANKELKTRLELLENK